MNKIIIITQIITSIILIILVLLQTSPETSQQRAALIKPKYSRRGMEKITYLLTFFFLFLFIALSVIQLFI